MEKRSDCGAMQISTPKGGLRTFAAGAKSDFNSRKADLQHKTHIRGAANGRKEPSLPYAPLCTNGCYHESDQKSSTTIKILNGFWGQRQSGCFSPVSKTRVCGTIVRVS
jgi:hypothetical protein